MGYSSAATPNRHPGDLDRPGTVIGRPPLVQQHWPEEGWQSKVGDAFGMACLFLVFVTWVIVPVCGGLALLLP
jgi:hypothetical protein